MRPTRALRASPLAVLLATALALSSAALARSPAAAGRDRDDEDERVAPGDKMFDFSDFAPAAPMASPPAPGRSLGATPGGAQDIDFARQEIAAGRVPHARTFTPEGLFSQHDLPLETGRRCTQLLCLTGAAVPVALTAQDEARTLAQLGFATQLDAATWRRDPLNLVAVVDKSGSMSGAPLETVKASLHQIVDLLGTADQLTVVLYGDTVHVQVPTGPAGTTADKAALHRAIDTIVSAGSTDMESGLRMGFDVARQTARRFGGRTRVMLFTDERPNVGDTSARGFMGMARAGSRDAIGLTTVGVGTQFGAELATAISSVRGGNLFFFADVGAMEAKFKRDFDTMVTELAHDMKLVVRPLPGHKLVGLYGVPGEAVKRLPDGGLEMDVETLFLSREKGGIFFAFAPEGGGALPPVPGAAGEASIRYVDLKGRTYSDRVTFDPWPEADPARPLPLGLARGRLLVDEVTTLKAAAAAHLERNDQEAAWRLVRATRQRFEQSGVPGLEREIDLLGRLDATLTRLSGHAGEGALTRAVSRDDVTGLPE